MNVLDQVINARIRTGGTIIGTINGALGSGIVASACIAMSPQPADLITKLAPIAIGLGAVTTAVLTLYNYIWRQNVRNLRNEIAELAGVVNIEEHLGRPKITDRRKIDIPFTMK